MAVFSQEKWRFSIDSTSQQQEICRNIVISTEATDSLIVHRAVEKPALRMGGQCWSPAAGLFCRWTQSELQRRPASLGTADPSHGQWTEPLN
jgi:hypothetical protein